MNERHVLLGAVLFLLFFKLEKDPTCKRTRKKIVRSIKNSIAVYKKVDTTNYLKLANAGVAIINSAYEEMRLRSVIGKINAVNPSKMLELMSILAKDDMDSFKLEKIWITEMSQAFEHIGLDFVSLMYVNRILKHIDIYLYDNYNLPTKYNTPMPWCNEKGEYNG